MFSNSIYVYLKLMYVIFAFPAGWAVVESVVTKLFSGENNIFF